MSDEKQNSECYTIEVARDLPLAEQLHKANIQLCHDLSVKEKVFLEGIRFSNGHKILCYRSWEDELTRK